MKSIQALKEELHELIDSIHDEENLQLLRKMILQNFMDDQEEDGELEALTEEQQAYLQQATRQAQVGEDID